MADSELTRQVRERMDAAGGRVRAALPADADTGPLADAIRARDAQGAKDAAQALGVGDQTLAALGDLLREATAFSFTIAADLVADRAWDA